jgi:hypothetical protein
MKKRQSISEQLREVESDGGGGSFIDMMHVPNGPKLVYPKKDAALRFGILPAIPQDQEGEYDKNTYLPYRDEDDQFTNWLSIFRAHRRVGGVMDILSPIFFGEAGTIDPLQIMWDYAWRTEECWDLICKHADTKKLDKDAWKTASLRRPEQRVLMNVVIPGETPGSLENAALICSKTAIFPYDYHPLGEKSLGPKKAGMWGLAEQLDKKAKGGKDAEQGDFEARFYEGDITDPTQISWCQLALTPSPTGGLQSYSCMVLDAEEEGMSRFKVSRRLLLGRSTPEEVFQEHSAIATADLAAGALVDITGGPELIAGAWGSLGLAYSTLVKKYCSGAKSADAKTTKAAASSRRQEDDEDDDIPMTPLKPVKPAVRALADLDEEDSPPFEKTAEDDRVPAKPSEKAAKAKSKASNEPEIKADKSGGSVTPDVAARRRSIQESLMADSEDEDEED